MRGARYWTLGLDCLLQSGTHHYTPSEVRIKKPVPGTEQSSTQGHDTGP